MENTSCRHLQLFIKLFFFWGGGSTCTDAFTDMKIFEAHTGPAVPGVSAGLSGGYLSVWLKASTPFVQHCFSTNVGLSLHLQGYRFTVPLSHAWPSLPQRRGHNSTYTTNGHIRVITVSPG